MARPAAEFQPPRELGGYRVFELLGKGGMSSVYRGEHALLERPVAIKFLRPEIARSAAAQQRFLREARLVARLTHPNIVTLFEFGVLSDGTYYQVSELVAGQTLRDLLRATRLEPTQALRFARQLALGLASAHELGIVHRDLKPSNVMAVPDRTQPEGHRLKILDFGIAKLVEPVDGAAVTLTGIAIGTPGYMSPEQCRGDLDIGPATDIYSLGVVMFAMLCGTGPFDAQDTDRLLDRHLHEAPLAPSRFIECSPEIDALVLACLAKAPHDRPRSMLDIVATLERLLGGEGGARATAAVAEHTARLQAAPRLMHLGFDATGATPATATVTVTEPPTALDPAPPTAPPTAPTTAPPTAPTRTRRRRVALAAAVAGLAIASGVAAAVLSSSRDPAAPPAAAAEAAPAAPAAPAPAPPPPAAAPPSSTATAEAAPPSPPSSRAPAPEPARRPVKRARLPAEAASSPSPRPATSQEKPGDRPAASDAAKRTDKPRDRVFETARY